VEAVETPGVQQAMMRLPGMWVRDGGWTTAQEYITHHLHNPTVRQAFGTTFDIHLLAMSLESKNVNTRLIVHTKGTNNYTWHRPFNPEGQGVPTMCPMGRLTGEDLISTDIVLVNTGNIHWSRAEWSPV
jgi:hypothetical protein